MKDAPEFSARPRSTMFPGADVAHERQPTIKVINALSERMGLPYVEINLDDFDEARDVLYDEPPAAA